ncbi:hypothetical protein HDU84_009547 [Entophlyctis sp. JEL0112]|nr:hypothetical protein HDU84_009547 [Entophlyctis sp. JEL0112]
MPRPGGSVRRVAIVAIATRVAVLLLATAIAWLRFRIAPPYDSSSLLLVPHATTESTASAFLSWDAVYFMYIASHPDTPYPFEQFNAFLPGYPFFVRAIADGLGILGGV